MRSGKLAMLAATSLLAFATSGALAADLPPPYRAPLPAPMYSWSGSYVGANIGYSWGSANYEATIIAVGSISHAEKMNGVIGGVQSGYNYQFGTFVIGTESDFQLSGQKGGSTFPGVLPGVSVTTTEKLEWFGTSRTRLGVLATPNILLYGTVGLAYGQVKESATTTVAGVGSAIASFKDVKAGLAAGAGIEGAFGGGWSAKLEYLYIDLGKTEHAFGTPGVGTIVSDTRHVTDNIVRVGLNYRWANF